MGRGARFVAGAIAAGLLVAALSGCCSMSRRPIPGICAVGAVAVA